MSASGLFGIGLVCGWAAVFPAPAAWRKVAGLALWAGALAVLARFHPAWLGPGLAGVMPGAALHWLIRHRIGETRA